VWFRESLSEILSLLHLRPRGVRHFIEFIAKQFYVPSGSQGSDDAGSVQITISPEGIAQITKLLSSVPTSLDPSAYFSQLAPQLLALLDGQDGPELSKVAAFVITDGILSKRSIGSPGSPGWKLFVEPLQETIDPKGSSTATEEELTLAQKRLWLLVQAHPSPALTGRLVRPLVPSLWGISTFKTPISSLSVNAVALEILKTFLRRCAALPILEWFIAHINWDGTLNWQFMPSSTGGIEIRKREASFGEPDLFRQLNMMEARISRFMELISNDNVELKVIGELFLQLTRESLLPGKSTKSLAHEDDNFQALVRAQVLRNLLEQFGSKLATDMQQTYELVNQLLEESLQSNQGAKKHLPTDRITRTDFSQIVPSDIATIPGEKWSLSEDSDDLIATSVSLLNAMLDARTRTSDSTRPILASILQNLQTLSSNPPANLSPSTLSAIASSILLLTAQLSVPDKDNIGAVQSVDETLLTRLAADLASPLPPTRVSALNTLLQVILDTTHILPMDVPTLALLLLNIIRTDSDSFVYSAAISTLSALAVTRDSSGFTLRTTVDTFADQPEQIDLDGRLRIGEALSTIIEAIADASRAGKHVASEKLLGQVVSRVLTVASRRGKRTREAKDRERTARLARLRQKQAETAWGGEVPELADLEENQTPESDYDEAQENEARTVVEGWANTGHEEDVRIRTSALSILSTILEHASPSSIDPETLSGAAEVPCRILARELDPSKGVLRRAAVMVFMAELRAEHSAFQEAGEKLKRSGWDGRTWMTIEETLYQSRDTDEDEIVRGHARAVLVSLDSFRFTRIAASSQAAPAEMGLTSLKGLEVNLPDPERKKPRIEEIE
jgi:Required for nuclear transport of RNA pol II C-terminus 1/Required for nuclear transport of RNA pol II C-terminus 2